MIRHLAIRSLVGIAALAGIAAGESAFMLNDPPNRAERDPEAPEFAEAWSCGTRCNGDWITVVTCYANQICCGYYYCSTGESQGSCCTPPNYACDYDDTITPPRALCVCVTCR